MWVCDIEGDGLLDELTKMHCFVGKRYLQDHIVVFCDLSSLSQNFIDDMSAKYPIEWKQLGELTAFVYNVGTIVIHNLFGYDLPALQKLGFIDNYDFYPENIDGYEVRMIDSLSMSRALYPDRPLPRKCPVTVHNPVTGRMDKVGPHGLMAWGYRVANMKPEVHDWRNQPLEVYVDRCIEDVIINELTLEALIKEMEDTPAGSNTPKLGKASDWKLPLKLNNKSDFLMCKQESQGILFDKESAEKLIIRVDKEMDKLAEEVEKDLPLRELSESARPNFPTNPFKDNGEISSYGFNWLKRLGYPVNDDAFNKPKYPAKPFKSDGSLSAIGEKYASENGIEGDLGYVKSQMNILRQKLEEIVPLPDDLLEKGKRDLQNKVMPDFRVPMEISNQEDIKQYLVESEGWNPTIWNTKDATRDQFKRNYSKEEQQDQILNYIEKSRKSPFKKFIYEEMGINFDKFLDHQLLVKLERKARFLITTPKLKDERGDLCPSLSMLKGEMAQKIIRWLSLRNRRSVISSKDEKKETGWLKSPRLNIDGRLGQGNSGVTNTNRYKHRTIVNLPKAAPDVLLGKEMRSLFIAPEGKKILGYDGSNLEQFVAGSYAWLYDGGDYAKKLEGDSHTTNAKAYSIAASREVTRSDGKNVTYACLPTDNTQVLTQDGWKEYKEITYSDEVLTYCEISCCYKWNRIQKIHHYKNRDIMKISNSHIGFESTPDHRWRVSKRLQKGHRGERYYKDMYISTDEITTECNIHNNSFYYEGNSGITPDQAALVGWLLSDGYYRWSEKDELTSSSFGKSKGIIAVITQSKNKYTKEVEECLERNNIRYTVHNKKDILNKSNPVYRYLLKSEDIRNFMDEVIKDRSQKHDVNWCAWLLKLSHESLKSFLHAFHLADGHTSKKGWMITQNKGNICDALILCGNLLGKRVTHTHKTDKCLVMNYTTKKHITCQRMKKEITRKGDVFCLTVPNGNFVIKQNDYVTITGNCLYGAQADKIAKMLGVPKTVGQAVIDAFWDTNHGLKKLKVALESYWEATGKKYIRGIDGRKIYTRSKHSLVNALFQSCGAILMAISGCFMYDLLLGEDYDLEEIIRLLYMHDEYQYEIPDHDIETFVFDTKEEALEFTYDDKLLSNIKEKDGQWERYYSRIGELGNLSLKMAGEYLNMPLPFRADYDIGINLAETH